MPLDCVLHWYLVQGLPKLTRQCVKLLGFCLLGRYLPIIGQIAIAGILAKKKSIPESAGTLRTDTVTFGMMTLAVIVIVAALSFFPAHALSTMAEYLSI